jgi:hypothetical protein
VSAEDRPVPLDEIDRLLARAVAAAPDGLTPAKARAALPKASRPPADVVAARLHAQADRGEIHRWPGRSARFATVALDDLVRQQLVVQLETGDALTATQLARHVVAAGRPRVRAVLAALVSEQRAHEHPPRGAGRTPLFSRLPADPRDYLSPDLDKLLARVARKGFALDAVRDAVRRWLHADDPRGGPVASYERAAAAQQEVLASGPVPDPTGDIVAMMLELNPQARHGALVYLPHLRHAVSDRFRDKLSFDRAILALRARGCLQLQTYPVPSELTPAERDAMVADGTGGFYMAAGLRQG